MDRVDTREARQQRRLTFDDDLPPVLSVEQAAHLLCICRGLAFVAVRAGDIPHVRIGRRILVSRDALREMLVTRERA